MRCARFFPRHLARRLRRMDRGGPAPANDRHARPRRWHHAAAHSLLLLAAALAGARAAAPRRAPAPAKPPAPAFHYPPQFADVLALRLLQRSGSPVAIANAIERFAIAEADLGRLLRSGSVELMVGGGLQAPPRSEPAQVLLLEALGQAPTRPEVIAAVLEWHFWELEAPPIEADTLEFLTDLVGRWDSAEPQNGAPLVARACVLWHVGNRIAALQACRDALERSAFDNHDRFQRQAVIRACEQVGYGPVAARDRALGSGATLFRAFRGVAAQLLRDMPPNEAPAAARTIDALGARLNARAQTLLQAEAGLATRLLCMNYLTQVPEEAQRAREEQRRLLAERDSLRALLDRHRAAILVAKSEDEWMGFFDRAIAEGEIAAMRAMVETTSR